MIQYRKNTQKLRGVSLDPDKTLYHTVTILELLMGILKIPILV